VRLAIARSFRRTLDQARFAQLLNANSKLSSAARRAKTPAMRQADPPGIHCEFCGGVKPSFEAPCPNDTADWPHPKGAA
jgi:hypothetical protein